VTPTPPTAPDALDATELDNAILRNLLAETTRAYEEQIRALAAEKEDQRLLALQLAHQATHDELTGLLNRRAFGTHLQRMIEESRRDGSTHALCYLDLDQFKLVNETCGHLAGDELLRWVTGLLQDGLGEEDLAARLGGDEFGLLLPRCSLAEAERRIASLHQELQGSPYVWQEKSFAVGASIGLVPITRRGKSVAHLLAAADRACYLAKEKGRSRVQVYQEDDAEFVRRQDEMNWVVRIHQTLQENRFRLFSQEIRPLSARAGQGLYFEVLLRMIEEDGRLHLPSDFIRAAERYGLMRSIDRWVVRHCAEALLAQPETFLDSLGTCAINLSAVSLGDETFLDYVLEQFTRFPVPAGKICFEITETAAIENLDQAGRLLESLSAAGFRFALDDFGTGMSSYSYLKEIPVSFLKIDGKFIQDMATDPLDRAMVESINQVGHVMGLQTVGEGVASGAAFERLRTLGVDYAQGNWVSPPGPLEEVYAVAAGVR